MKSIKGNFILKNSNQFILRYFERLQCGFGILPEYRNQGYGKQALKSAINILYKNKIYDISLEVETKNKNALKLYKSCGFAEKSVINYYEVVNMT